MARKHKTVRKPSKTKRKPARTKRKPVRSRKSKYTRKRVKKNQKGGATATGAVFVLKKALEFIEREGADILDKCFKEQGFENFVELRKKAIELKDKAIIKGNNYKEIVEELIKMKDSLIKLGSLNKSDLINCFKSSIRAKLSNKINKPLEVLGSGIGKLKGHLKPGSNMDGKIEKLKGMIATTKRKIREPEISVSEAHAAMMKKHNL